VLLQLLLLEPLVQLQLLELELERLHRNQQLHNHQLCRKKNHSRFRKLEQLRSKLVLVHSRLAPVRSRLALARSRLALACSTSPWLACTFLACSRRDQLRQCL